MSAIANSRRLGVITLMLLLQSGCFGQSQKVATPVNKMEEMTEKQMPKLDVNYDLSGSEITVEYNVKNTTGKAIYLFNVLPAPGSFDRVADQPLYCAMRDDGTLAFAKMVPPVPKIRTVEFRQIPFVTRVEAGKAYTEKLRLRVPVNEFNPYFPSTDESETEPVTSERAVFILQFIREDDGLETKETAIQNALKVWHRDLFSHIETLATDARPIQVKADRRKDEFERF